MATTKPVSIDSSAVQVGANMTKAQDNLLRAYNLKEGASKSEISSLATALGLKGKEVSVRSLQLVAEQRFQHASQVFSLFSGLLDKIDQMKQRIINRFSN